jgi:hypothetical protein
MQEIKAIAKITLTLQNPAANDTNLPKKGTAPRAKNKKRYLLLRSCSILDKDNFRSWALNGARIL